MTRSLKSSAFALSAVLVLSCGRDSLSENDGDSGPASGGAGGQAAGTDASAQGGGGATGGQGSPDGQPAQAGQGGASNLIDAAGGQGGDSPRPDAGPVDAAPMPDAALVPDAAPPPDAAIPDAAAPERLFSFFVTSLEAMRRLSGSPDGFGGDFGGLDGADALCQTIAGEVGVGHKTWRAFLSAVRGSDGRQVNAIDRIGVGPWYDANERLIAENLRGLTSGDRPVGDPAAVADLPDEHGVPISALGDAHDVVTASSAQGLLANNNMGSTCNDWTSDSGQVGANAITCGHSFPRMRRGGGGLPDGASWLSDHMLRGCAPGVNLIQNGPGVGVCIGCSGGYGALYCFAVTASDL